MSQSLARLYSVIDEAMSDEIKSKIIIEKVSKLLLNKIQVPSSSKLEKCSMNYPLVYFTQKQINIAMRSELQNVHWDPSLRTDMDK